MKIKFLQDCKLIIVENYDEKTDRATGPCVTFHKGEVIDVDILEHRSDSTDWQFEDGSCACVVSNELFESVGKFIYQEIIETIECGGFIRFNGNLVTTVNSDKWKDDVENEVIYLEWEEEGQEYSEQISEEDFDYATIENNEIVIDDYEKYPIRITLYRKYDISLTPKKMLSL